MKAIRPNMRTSKETSMKVLSMNELVICRTHHTKSSITLLRVGTRMTDKM